MQGNLQDISKEKTTMSKWIAKKIMRIPFIRVVFLEYTLNFYHAGMMNQRFQDEHGGYNHPVHQNVELMEIEYSAKAGKPFRSNW